MRIAALLRREMLASRRSWLAMALGFFAGFQLFQLVRPDGAVRGISELS